MKVVCITKEEAQGVLSVAGSQKWNGDNCHISVYVPQALPVSVSKCMPGGQRATLLTDLCFNGCGATFGGSGMKIQALPLCTPTWTNTSDPTLLQIVLEERGGGEDWPDPPPPMVHQLDGTQKKLTLAVSPRIPMSALSGLCWCTRSNSSASSSDLDSSCEEEERENGAYLPVNIVVLMMKDAWSDHCILRYVHTYFLVHLQGPTGAELGTLGAIASIRLKIKNSCYATRGHQGQKVGHWEPWQASD